MTTLINRGLSLIVASAYVIVAAVYGNGADALRVMMALLLPMACIWFSEALGEYGGTMRLPAITSPTPAFLVCAVGWLLLLGVPVIAYFAVRASEQA